MSDSQAATTTPPQLRHYTTRQAARLLGFSESWVRLHALDLFGGSRDEVSGDYRFPAALIDKLAAARDARAAARVQGGAK